MVAGLVIFPLLFALGLETQVMGGETGTLGALFVVLPQAFASMGAAGPFVGGVFMVALSVAAVTSAMSLLEVVVSSAVDGLGWSRSKASIVSGGAIALLGIPAALDIGILELMDSVGGQLFLLVGGFFLALFVGWGSARRGRRGGRAPRGPPFVAVPAALGGPIRFAPHVVLPGPGQSRADPAARGIGRAARSRIHAC